MSREKELQQRKEFTKSAPLEDYLHEDPPVYNQNFFILSYLLPEANNELQFPTIKVRGSFKNQEDCQKRINQLKNLDPYFNMYVCEVGKFGSLLPEDELKKMDDIDVEYRESLLNTMAKEYQENKDKADLEFQKRKEFMKKRAEFEGSKEGQELLANKKENPVAVKTRIETMSKHFKELEARLIEVKEIISLSEKQLQNDYSSEELEEAKKEYKEKYNEEFTVKDHTLIKTETSKHDQLFSAEDPFLANKTK